MYTCFPWRTPLRKGVGWRVKGGIFTLYISLLETSFVKIIYYFSKTKIIKGVSKIPNNVQLYFWSQNFKTLLRCDMHHILSLKGPSRLTGLTVFSAGSGMKLLPHSWVHIWLPCKSVKGRAVVGGGQNSDLIDLLFFFF